MPLYERSVFINCPYDDLYEPLFHATVLAIAALGFTPRCARESAGEALPRIVRITNGLLTCKYSVHDLTRFQGEGPDKLARFNMPLELGMALGVRALREGTGQTHNWVALVPKAFVHHQFISDLAGYDLPGHDDQPATVIGSVMAWLGLQPDFSPPCPTAKTVLGTFPHFTTLLDKAKDDALGTLTWPAIVRSAEGVVSGMPTA